jgi:hypothetical protein
MSKLNFEQRALHSRELGGVSSVTVLAIAFVLCSVWSLLIQWSLLIRMVY